MLFANEVLEDLQLLELSDPLSSGSFPPVCCPCWLFLSSLVSVSRESLCTSCYCAELPFSVTDSVVNVDLVEV